MFKSLLHASLISALLAAPLLAAGPVKESSMADASFDFANRLFKLHAGDANDSQNLVFSPLSIHMALTMTSAGAAGNTLAQMQKVLATDGKAHEAYSQLAPKLLGYDTQSETSQMTFVLSNNLWLQNGYAIEPAFANVLQDDYRAAATPLDFSGAADASRKAINTAVAKQTQDKIKDLLGTGSVTAQTRLVLTNAVYFKASWAKPFREATTTQSPFHLLDGTLLNDVPTMHQTANLRLYENDELKVLEMPYRGNEASMLLILSKTAAVNKSLDVENALADLPIFASRLAPRQVTVALPKFKFDTQLQLVDDLKTLGMPDAFSDKADFSGITAKERLAIGAVIHKAFIAVDENGTEAAAATGISVGTMAAHQPPPPAEFIADRPFLFAIRHNATGAILFLGRVAKP